MDLLCRFDHIFHMVTGLSGKHPDLVNIRLDHRRTRLDPHFQKLSACIQDDRFSGFFANLYKPLVSSSVQSFRHASGHGDDICLLYQL